MKIVVQTKELKQVLTNIHSLTKDTKHLPVDSIFRNCQLKTVFINDNQTNLVITVRPINFRGIANFVVESSDFVGVDDGKEHVYFFPSLKDKINSISSKQVCLDFQEKELVIYEYQNPESKTIIEQVNEVTLEDQNEGFPTRRVWAINTEYFKYILEEHKNIICKDVCRPNLCHLLFRFGDRFEVCSTDGRRMSYIKNTIFNEPETEDFMMPLDLVSVLIKILKKGTKEGNNTISILKTSDVNSENVTFVIKYMGNSFYIKKEDFRFPDYHAIVDPELDKITQKDIREFECNFDKVADFLDKKKEDFVHMNVVEDNNTHNKMLEIKCGEFQTKMECKFHEETKWSCDRNFFIDALKFMKANRCKMYLGNLNEQKNTILDPVVFCNNKVESIQMHILMPTRN